MHKRDFQFGWLLNISSEKAKLLHVESIFDLVNFGELYFMCDWKFVQSINKFASMERNKSSFEAFRCFCGS